MEWIYHIFISEKEFKNYEKILLKVSGFEGEYMRFMSRHVGHGKYYVGEPAVYSLKDSKDEFKKKECVEVYGLKDDLEYEIKLISASDIILTINNNKDSIKAINDFLTIYTHENKEDNLKFCFFHLKKQQKMEKKLIWKNKHYISKF